MKIKNYVEIREKRERLKSETWDRIEKYITTLEHQAPIEMVKKWYELENSRFRRPEYPVQFRILYRRILTKHNLYMNSRKKFDQEHEELLIELETDRGRIERANAADLQNEEIYLKNLSKKESRISKLSNLKEQILGHQAKIRSLNFEIKRERAEYSRKKSEYDEILNG